jgi:hypothetical protein
MLCSVSSIAGACTKPAPSPVHRLCWPIAIQDSQESQYPEYHPRVETKEDSHA